jgi:hypothetical protein
MLQFVSRAARVRSAPNQVGKSWLRCQAHPSSPLQLLAGVSQIPGWPCSASFFLVQVWIPNAPDDWGHHPIPDTIKSAHFFGGPGLTCFQPALRYLAPPLAVRGALSPSSGVPRLYTLCIVGRRDGC